MQNVYRAEAATAMFAFETMRRKVDELSRRNEDLRRELTTLRAQLDAKQTQAQSARRVPISGTYNTVRPPSMGGDFASITPLKRIGGV